MSKPDAHPPAPLKGGARAEIWKWYYATGRDPETYNETAETLEAAIAAGRAEFGNGVFTVIEAVQRTTADLALPDGESFIDLIIDGNADAWGDEGFDDFAGNSLEVKAAQDEFDALAAAWFERYRHIFPAPVEFKRWRNQQSIEPSSEPSPLTVEQGE